MMAPQLKIVQQFFCPLRKICLPRRQQSEAAKRTYDKSIHENLNSAAAYIVAIHARAINIDIQTNDYKVTNRSTSASLQIGHWKKQRQSLQSCTSSRRSSCKLEKAASSEIWCEQRSAIFILGIRMRRVFRAGRRIAGARKLSRKVAK